MSFVFLPNRFKGPNPKLCIIFFMRMENGTMSRRFVLNDIDVVARVTRIWIAPILITNGELSVFYCDWVHVQILDIHLSQHDTVTLK